MISLSNKSYLSNQIRLITICASDLFTDEQYELYMDIIQKNNRINQIESIDKKDKKEEDEIEKSNLIASKKEAQESLTKTIQKHKGVPRQVRLKSLLDTRRIDDANNMPNGVSWFTLKPSRRIAEFASEESRAMGLSPNEITFDKIIVKWKSKDILQQIILDGFYMDILLDNGDTEKKHYSIITGSAGQLRTDKLQAVSDTMWQKIRKQLMCGMSEDLINSKKGINLGKLCAYMGLPASATEESDINIDNCIVIPDWEGSRTGDLNYLTQDYVFERGVRTVEGINFIDGGGICLPGVLNCGNAMVRAPFLKGLLSEFDFILWCLEHDCKPIIKDVWGKEHNLIEEDIKVMFTASQLKLWKYYDSWDHYKACFKENGCHICLTNYEEDWIKDTNVNYQFLQALDMTDAEIEELTKEAHEKIINMTRDKDSMLKVLDATKTSESPYQQALYYYPQLLREAYSRNTLKAIKKRWLYDAKSGFIKCKNKRLFVIPDWYAACEYYFLHEENPKGILEANEVYAKLYERHDQADILRSPSLSFEHAIRKFSHSEECRKWFKTKGIYISCHDFLDRILQLDFDGDMLNVVTEPCIINAAKRKAAQIDFAPLFYDANKAPAKEVNRHNLYESIWLAHEYSGIGVYSNMITKLWNKDEPDHEAAAMICAQNNYAIDAAKTGFINSYENHPQANKRVQKAIGGKRTKMPYFFQFTKNGRKSLNDKKSYMKPNRSTMNRIALKFEDIGNINLNYAGVPKFNWQMLISQDNYEYYPEAIDIFCKLDDSNRSAEIEFATTSSSNMKVTDIENMLGYEVIRDDIIHEIEGRFNNLETVYPSIVKYLFTGQNIDKTNHKQMFWRVFGEIVLRNIKENINNCDICPECNIRIPSWVRNHVCNKTGVGFFECVDCGKMTERINSRQCRCQSCQIEHRLLTCRINNRKHYQSKKEGA